VVLNTQKLIKLYFLVAQLVFHWSKNSLRNFIMVKNFSNQTKMQLLMVLEYLLLINIVANAANHAVR